MARNGSILIVDDNRSIISALRILLSGRFDNIYTISSPKTLKSFMRENVVDVVLLDMNFDSGINSGNEGLFWLSEIKNEYGNRVEVVLMTAYADIELAIKGMKNGACDFVVKPWDNTKLISIVKNACEVAISNKSTKKLKDIYISPGNRQQMFWGTSTKMQQLKELVTKVAAADANILIIGENGTGKEVLAKEIHLLSARRNRQFITVDMGAVTETLFESELFGHVKGAFTDAKADREGKFESANSGTLFLDEIGNLPLHLQSKLLTVLQTRKVTRVGANQPTDIDIRLISATNLDIEKMADSGGFRMDLLYRMNTITVRLIPLRERKEDIIPFAEMFIAQYCEKYNKPKLILTDEAATKLLQHCWSGNIRELQHAVERAVIMCDNMSLKESDCILSENGIGIKNSDELIAGDSTLEDMECKMIRCAIEKYESNISMVASALGVSRQTLYNKMKKYNL